MFEYEGIIMRPIEERDLENMVRLRGDPKVWMHLGDITMVNLRSQHEWFQKLSADPSRRYYILASGEDVFLGIVRMDELDWVNRSIRVGGDIVPEHQGKGYGHRMFKLLSKYCFDFLNLERLWLLVMESNIVAQKLYEKAGFTEEGRQRKAIFRDGKYQDYIMMSLLREEWRRVPKKSRS